MQKRIVSLLLVLVMLVSLFPAPAQAAETDSNVDSGMTVEGTNGFGNLLSAELQAEYEEETQDNGNYSVLGLEITGNTAKVEYASMEEAVLVVALYSEDGMQLLTSGKTTVDPTEDIATVTIEGNMPEYFQASAYLVDAYDFSPLCASYDTPMYTREMQELLASTVEDYDADRVLQLDEDKTTNFAVYAEDTILIEERAGVNAVASVNDETSTYVIENADESITSLREGDIFAYPYGDNEILIVKVASISVSGTTVTITGEEMEMEEAFSHVKIEATGNTADMQMHGDTVEGVTFEGLVSDGVAPMAADGSVSMEKTLKYGLDKELKGEANYAEASVEIDGSLGLKLRVEFSFYVSASRQFLDLETGVTLKAEVSVSGELAGKLPLPGFGFSPVAGVYIDFQPNLKLEFSGQLSYSLSFGVTMSMTYESGNGFGFHFKAEADSKLELEGAVFFGIDMNPSLGILGAAIKTELSMPVGVKLEAKFAKADPQGASTIHTCEKCLDMELKFEAEVEVELKFLNMDKLTLEKKTTFQMKIGDMYYSFDKEVLGWGKCPNLQYRVTVQVRNGIGTIANAPVTANGKAVGRTDNEGILKVYLPAGKYQFCATVDGQNYGYITNISKATKVVLRDVENFDDIGLDFLDYINGSVTDGGAVIASGSCGGNTTWTLSEGGVLTVSGSGSMADYESDTTPWYNYRSNITRVIIRDGVTRIGEYAFYKCGLLGQVLMADSVTTIGQDAFYSCQNLTDVVLSENVTDIQNRAFSECINLPRVVIPAGVKRIGNHAFSFCDNLAEVVLQEGVTTIDPVAFGSCGRLTSIKIPESVTSLGNGAFSGTGLTEVVIPKSITRVENSLFSDCRKLASVELHEDITYIGDYAFNTCQALTEIDIPDKVNYIGKYAFQKCAVLTEIVIPEGVPSIGECTFSGCKRLTRAVIPDGVTSIGEDAFLDCVKLTEVVIPGSVESIDTSAFGGCGLTRVEICEGVPSIGYSVFSGCSSLASVVLPASLTTIEWGAFKSCYKLSDVYYGGSEDQWKQITINDDTGPLEDATVHYNTTGPAAAAEILSAETVTQKIPKLDAIYGGEYDTEELEDYTLKTASFTGLVPNEEYLLLALVNLEAEDILSANNLLYIDQAVAGEDGTLAFEYVQRTPATVSYVMACGASNKNLNDAVITFPEMTADGAVHAVDPTVTYEGTTLTEGTDYVLLGDVTYTEVGTYTCFVRGVHRYTGLAECSYTVAVPEEEPVTPPTEETTPQETEPAGSEPVESQPTQPEVTEPSVPEDTRPAKPTEPEVTKPTEPEETKPQTKPTEPDEPKYENPFEDVFEADYYYDPVLWAVNEGITNGMDATHFAPAGTCTRAQIVTFLWRANGSPASGGTNPFTDVPADAWYTNAVLWAVENGITTGTSATTFSPDAGCTRGQVATFLWRSQGQPSVNGENIFTDIAYGAYYYDAVLWAVANGITNGMGEGLFAPDATCTRGQIVTFLYRAMNE